MKESVIQGKILKLLKSRGAYAIKVIQASTKGKPDIIACYRGLFLGLEIKTPETRTKVSALQEHNLEEIKAAGGIAYVMWDVEYVEGLLDELDRRLDEAV